MDLQELQSIAATCTLCELCRGRNKPVFARGATDTNIMICGMCPGPDENEVGSPFVGRAGRLLDEVIDHASIDAPDLRNAYITNLVKCYVKPGIELAHTWMETCLPYFMAQVYLLKPKVIISLGKDVSSFLLDIPNAQMKDMRGKVFDYDINRSIKVVSTYHPSFILRSGGNSSKYFKVIVDDFKISAQLLKEVI